MTYPDDLTCDECGEQITDDDTAITERSNVEDTEKTHYHLTCKPVT